MALGQQPAVLDEIHFDAASGLSGIACVDTKQGFAQ